MKTKSSSEIRQMYLDFFAEHGHKIMPSMSLIPVDDPTLLWINSGVATMKKYFDGSVVPDNPRMTSSQKSIRTNDIENVGKTARHHTLFEMLGNFSVGDYFKSEAIHWAWELLTSDKWFGFDPEKLYITVYPKDLDAKKEWLDAGVLEDHILENEDNFWDIGEGPSGPDSEIFYDRGQNMNNVSEDDPENYPGGENERYLEIWNIVFSQYNHTPDGKYEPLPNKNIDTGMGLERIVSIFQNAKTNFETDLFMPIINEVESISNKKYGVDNKYDVCFKIIADHIRSITFAICDGALPSNDGRGYVIRRLLRRAVLNGEKLGINSSFLYKLVPVVGKIMESHYPEITQQKDYISKIVKSEEEKFNKTLTSGLNLLNNVIKEAKESGYSVIDGKTSFKLFDTYGFPLELTKEYANDNGLDVDEKEFNEEMSKQKERSRNAREKSDSMKLQNPELRSFKEQSYYLGYDQLSVNNAKIIAMFKDEKIVDKAFAKDEVQIIFDNTPFYAEMGGQVADTGNILLNNEVVGKVIDVQKAPNGQHLHNVKVLNDFELNNTFTLEVDVERHKKISKNHTATHLLDQSLRNILGSHTHQAGSLVEPEYLRFDFNHFGPVSQEDLNKVEQLVNEQIFNSIDVKTIETDLDSAKKMGAIAMFSDKYGENVRVVSIGKFNQEFCGGNHVDNTSEIGLFKIISESGIGSGIRRIEAVTSLEAFNYLNDQSSLLKNISILVKEQNENKIPEKIIELQNSVKKLNQTVNKLQDKVVNSQSSKIFDNVVDVNGIKLVTFSLNDSNMDQLRKISDTWRQKEISDILVLATNNDSKVNLLATVSDSLVEKGYFADDLIKYISKEIKGGGGGRHNLAQAGGKDATGISKAFTKVVEWIKNKD